MWAYPAYIGYDGFPDESNCSTYGFFPRKAMGYGISESYGFSLITNLVNSKMYGLLKSMGYWNYGLWEIRLYLFFFFLLCFSVVSVW